MYNLSKNIADIRIKKRYTQKSLADALNVSKGTITSYESGVRVPPVELEEMAKLFDIKISDFFKEDINTISLTKSDTNSKIPIVSRVSAGLGVYGNDDILDWLEMPSSLCKGADYATFVKGDSMKPKILDNDLILVHKTNTLDNGNIGIFKVGEDVFCKKFFSNPITKEVVLKSLNEKYDPIYINEDNGEEFLILGRVICKIDYNF